MSTAPDGLYQYGGVPVSSGPDTIFGKVWFVDDTNGSDGNDGRTIGESFATIQTAITAQGDNATGLGDVIYVLPGTYVESLTGDLTDCSLIGAMPNRPLAVKITPTDGSAYAGTLNNAVVRGISFYSSSESNPTYAAFRAQRMLGSTIDGCLFYAGAVSETSTGFRIGHEASTESTPYDKMSESSFTNNRIGTRYGGLNCHYGICFGPSKSTDANNRYVYMQDSVIANNAIAAEAYGIMMGVIYTSGSNAIVAHNYVHGGLLYAGQCHNSGIRAYDRGHDNKLIKVYDNRVSAQSDCIDGFAAQNVMGNIIGTGGGTSTPVGETPAT